MLLYMYPLSSPQEFEKRGSKAVIQQTRMALTDGNPFRTTMSFIRGHNFFSHSKRAAVKVDTITGAFTASSRKPCSTTTPQVLQMRLTKRLPYASLNIVKFSQSEGGRSRLGHQKWENNKQATVGPFIQAHLLSVLRNIYRIASFII
jgi:hypothetical protein